MFKVTETIRHKDFHRVSSAVGRTRRDALDRVLEHSPYNRNLNQRARCEVIDSLADEGKAYEWWTEFTCEYRSDLTDCQVLYSSKGGHIPDECGVVESHEGGALRVRKGDGEMDQVAVDAVLSFTATPTDDEIEKMIASLNG